MNKPKEFKLGWLSPDGELVECNSFDHISSASEICDKLGYSYTNARGNTPDDVLLAHGWLHLTYSMLDHEYRIYYAYFNHVRLTEAQRAYIRPFKEMGYTFGDLFEMTWQEKDSANDDSITISW